MWWLHSRYRLRATSSATSQHRRATRAHDESASKPSFPARTFRSRDLRVSLTRQDVPLRKQQADLEKRLTDLNERIGQLQGTNDEQRGNVSTITNLKLPAFWKDQPKIWFHTIESTFENCRITSDKSKFRYVVSNLDQTTAVYVADIIENPPDADRYDALKNRIIETFGETNETKLRRLLRDQTVSDEKPMHILAKIINLAGSNCNNAVLRNLFLEHLPENVRPHLVIGEVTDLSKLAQQADKIVDIIRPSTSLDVCSIGNSDNAALNAMKAAIEKLTREFQEFRRAGNKNNESRARSRARSTSKNRNSAEDANSDLCFYHSRFKEKARKCRPPCNFDKPVN